REFGLFQALGMRPRFILGQVMCEAFFLLLIGLAIGNLLSLLTLQIYSDGIDVSGLAKGAQLVGLSNVIPLTSQLNDVVVANALVIGLGLLASFYPAWRAARYVPVEAITRT
ncbi:MAG TPA: FtsX-like permease family protein, partial [Acidiferrobacteraceae bacterium]|nr:FtsX-like permease family protein [Acidiferrobacteraceae bacterium]HEX20673.1 FtsX-like permease family protein [Acidiferrobacteraceae bacterium]